jgi:hypothetical protein
MFSCKQEKSSVVGTALVSRLDQNLTLTAVLGRTLNSGYFPHLDDACAISSTRPLHISQLEISECPDCNLSAVLWKCRRRPCRVCGVLVNCGGDFTGYGRSCRAFCTTLCVNRNDAYLGIAILHRTPPRMVGMRKRKPLVHVAGARTHWYKKEPAHASRRNTLNHTTL